MVLEGRYLEGTFGITQPVETRGVTVLDAITDYPHEFEWRDSVHPRVDCCRVAHYDGRVLSLYFKNGVENPRGVVACVSFERGGFEIVDATRTLDEFFAKSKWEPLDEIRTQESRAHGETIRLISQQPFVELGL